MGFFCLAPGHLRELCGAQHQPCHQKTIHFAAVGFSFNPSISYVNILDMASPDIVLQTQLSQEETPALRNLSKDTITWT